MTDKSYREAFLLKPAGKDYLWGGRRLKDDFSKDISMTPLAETWECSTHPDGESIVAGGMYRGMTLSRVLSTHPDFLGVHQNPEGALPILVKLIDARNDLSVQVHPDDKYAFEKENGQLGKTEMWYVIDAARDASLVYGLKTTMSRDEMRSAIASGKLTPHLQRVEVQKNDVFFIKSGMIHAIGAGCLIAEVQESSNLTYRLYDYDRVDRNGQKRELHVDKALDVACLDAQPEPRQPLRVLKYSPGMARELLSRCKYFEVYRMLINTERHRLMATYTPDELSYSVLLCIDGCGFVEGTNSFCFFKGDCIFVPARLSEFKIHGKAVFLDIRG